MKYFNLQREICNNNNKFENDRHKY